MGKLTAQQEKASALGNHLLVTANAGSGKTKVLSGRYIKALLEENVKVNEIAAITYTDKAASELYAKIRKELVEIHENTKDQTERVRIDGMIKDLINSNISTIHSFCAGLLREYPVEAGIDPSFNLIAPGEATQLVMDATTEVIAESLPDPEISPEIKKIIRLFRSTANFKAAMLKMINERKKIKTYTGHLGENTTRENILQNTHTRLGELINTLFPTLDQLVGMIGDVNNLIIDSGGSEIATAAGNAINSYKNASDPIGKYVALSHLLGIISTTTGEKKIRSTGYLTKKIRDGLDGSAVNDLETLHAHLVKFFKPITAPDIEQTKKLLELHAENSSLLLKYYFKILARYNEKKNALNCIDYEDMLLLSAVLLENPAVKKVLAGKFKYIMIDEYQDTNDLQFDIFLPLLNDLSVGNLYVVGDKKQSIYGFRDADLTVFDRTKEKIEGNAGGSVILEHTFRLTRELTAFVNHIFPPVFSSRNPLLDGDSVQFTKKRKLTNAVEYQQTLFFDTGKTYKESSIGLILNRAEDPRTSVELLREQEAEILAAHLKKHFDELTEKSKTEDDPLTIAILTRTRKNFAYLEKALAALDIPYELMGGKQFYQQQVVTDISLVFNFLADPADDLNLYALLRSPFFSLSDADILEISNVPGNSALEKLGIVAGSLPGRDRFALDLLNELLLFSTEARPNRVIDFMLSRTPYLAVMRARPDGKQNIANIDKLVAQSVAFDSFRFNSIHDYREWLSDLILTEETETQAPLSDSVNSVKLMTIHQSKGLEFTTVYLFACGDAAFATQPVKDGEISLHKDLGLIFKVSETGDIFYPNTATMHFDMAAFLNSRVEMEEAKRVFYVAVTRAANNLFISASVKGETAPKNSFLEMLMTGLGWDSLPGEDQVISARPLTTAISEGDRHIETTEDEVKLTLHIIEPEIIKEPDSDQSATIIGALKPQIMKEKIEKKYSGEIISASKYLTYHQCPFKYYLTYISGLAGIPGLEEFFIPQPEDTETPYDPADDGGLAKIEAELPSAPVGNLGAAIGTIVHAYLAMAPAGATLLSAVTMITDSLTSDDPTLAKSREKLISRSVEILSKYLATPTSGTISAYYGFLNEEELFIRYNDFYLMGVIDKLVILEDRIVIIDYKTDRDPAHSLERYREQLRFYAYICSQVYKKVDSFELRLVFLSNPEAVKPELVTRAELSVVKDKIDSLITALRGSFASGEFSKNTSHCGECRFSFNTGHCLGVRC